MYGNSAENTRFIYNPRSATQQTVRRYFKKTSRHRVVAALTFAAQRRVRLVLRVARGCTVSGKIHGCAKISACHAQPRAGSRNSVPASENSVASRFRKKARRSLGDLPCTYAPRFGSMFVWPSHPCEQRNQRSSIVTPIRLKLTPKTVLTSKGSPAPRGAFRSQKS